MESTQMSGLGFFTPICYGPYANTLEKKAIENIDNYFHFWGKQARIFPGHTSDGKERVFIYNTNFTELTLLKIAGIALSYFTVIIPVIMLIAKFMLRNSHEYKMINMKEVLMAELKSLPVEELEKMTIKNDVKKVKKVDPFSEVQTKKRVWKHKDPALENAINNINKEVQGLINRKENKRRSQAN